MNGLHVTVYSCSWIRCMGIVGRITVRVFSGLHLHVFYSIIKICNYNAILSNWITSKSRGIRFLTVIDLNEAPEGHSRALKWRILYHKYNYKSITLSALVLGKRCLCNCYFRRFGATQSALWLWIFKLFHLLVGQTTTQLSQKYFLKFGQANAFIFILIGKYQCIL